MGMGGANRLREPRPCASGSRFRSQGTLARPHTEPGPGGLGNRLAQRGGGIVVLPNLLGATASRDFQSFSDTEAGPPSAAEPLRHHKRPSQSTQFSLSHISSKSYE